jgi:polyisoprenoid-binding protein YceI
MPRVRLVVLVLAAASATRAADLYEAEPSQVLASYEASLGASRVTGTSGSLEWTIEKLDGGESRVRLVMHVDSFGSGHPAIDAALRDAMDSARFPTVEIQGVARNNDSSLRGTITVHGICRPLVATLALTRVGSRLVLRTSLTVALDAFGVVPPALAQDRIGNVFDVTVVGLLRVHPDSVLTDGAVGSTD